MSEQENMAIVRRYFDEVVNQGNLAAVDELFSPRYVTHHNDPAGLPPGPEGVRQFVATTRAGFSDFQLTVNELFAVGEQVAVRWTMEGTHTAPFFNLPPTNKHVAWVGIVILRIEGGKIAEDWYNFDQLSLLQQLGAIPAGG